MKESVFSVQYLFRDIEWEPRDLNELYEKYKKFPDKVRDLLVKISSFMKS